MKEVITTNEQLKGLSPGTYVVSGEAAKTLIKQTIDEIDRQFAEMKVPPSEAKRKDQTK